MATTQWTDSDALNAKDALVVGGPSDGLLIPVNSRAGQLRYPAAFDATGYTFLPERWMFIHGLVDAEAQL